jgi:hypothetical protein
MLRVTLQKHHQYHVEEAFRLVEMQRGSLLLIHATQVPANMALHLATQTLSLISGDRHAHPCQLTPPSPAIRFRVVFLFCLRWKSLASHQFISSQTLSKGSQPSRPPFSHTSSAFACGRDRLCLHLSPHPAKLPNKSMKTQFQRSCICLGSRHISLPCLCSFHYLFVLVQVAHL